MIMAFQRRKSRSSHRGSISAPGFGQNNAGRILALSRSFLSGANLERKGGLVLLEAFRRLRERAPVGHPIDESGLGIELHLVTRDVLPPEPGVFLYNDMQPNSAELKQLYFDCDIFCLPTQADCLPMALSEAGAAGLPCVSTQIAAIPEIVIDGETGFLIPPGSVSALENALQRLIDDEPLRLSMSRAAFDLTSQRFDAEKNTAQLIALLKQTIADHKK